MSATRPNYWQLDPSGAGERIRPDGGRFAAHTPGPACSPPPVCTDLPAQVGLHSCVVTHRVADRAETVRGVAPECYVQARDHVILGHLRHDSEDEVERRVLHPAGRMPGSVAGDVGEIGADAGHMQPGGVEVGVVGAAQQHRVIGRGLVELRGRGQAAFGQLHFVPGRLPLGMCIYVQRVSRDPLRTSEPPDGLTRRLTGRAKVLVVCWCGAPAPGVWQLTRGRDGLPGATVKSWVDFASLQAVRVIRKRR